MSSAYLLIVITDAWIDPIAMSVLALQTSPTPLRTNISKLITTFYAVPLTSPLFIGDTTVDVPFVTWT